MKHSYTVADMLEIQKRLVKYLLMRNLILIAIMPVLILTTTQIRHQLERRYNKL
jgi:hypothetical protein